MWQPGMTLEEVEKQVVFQALRFYAGNKLQTASALGISSRTLYNKLEVYEKQREVLVGKGAEIQAVSVQVSGGGGVESPAKTTEKQSVPVRERKEVQKVSSR